jgi:MFS family permease
VVREVRAAVRNAVAATVAGTLVQPYVKKLAIELGATDLQLGYLSSWPNLVSIVAVLGVAGMVARSKEKSKVTGQIVLAGRFAALGAAAVPYLPETLRVWALIIFWVLFSVPASAAGAPVQSLIAEIFGPNERGRVLARRQSAATVAGSSVGLLSGWILDQYLAYPLGYQIMFCLSFLAALVEVYYLWQLREPVWQAPTAAASGGAAVAEVAASQGPSAAEGAPERAGRFAAYLKVFRHRPFLLFLICSLPFHFTWQMAWPLFDRYQISYLGANNTWVQIINLANSSGAFFVYPIWQRLAERYGNQLMLGVATLFLGLAPFLTALATGPATLAAINLFLGIGVSGVVLLLMNTMLDVSPSEDRPIYLAVHTALVAVTGTIAPLVGALLMSVLPIRLGLMLCTLFRLTTGCSFFLLSWREKRRKEQGRLVANSETDGDTVPPA